MEAALELAEPCQYLLTWRLGAKAQARMGNKYSRTAGTSAERAVIDDDLSWNVVQLTLACAEFDSHDAQFFEMLLRAQRTREFSHGQHAERKSPVMAVSQFVQ